MLHCSKPQLNLPWYTAVLYLAVFASHDRIGIIRIFNFSHFDFSILIQYIIDTLSTLVRVIAGYEKAVKQSYFQSLNIKHNVLVEQSECTFAKKFTITIDSNTLIIKGGDFTQATRDGGEGEGGASLTLSFENSIVLLVGTTSSCRYFYY